MNNVTAKNWKEVEKYREKIFKSKEEYHKALAKLPLKEKIRIANDLYRFGVEFKKAKTKNWRIK